MPVKVDTRKKTRKQKEKNRRRKKRNQSRKEAQGSESLFQRIRRSFMNKVGPKQQGPKSRRAPSMQAIHGVVANAYASRMPVGSNHTKGVYANTETGLSSKNFFKRTLRQMKRAQKQDLPPTYSYQIRPRPIYPEEIHVQPIGLAEPSKSLHNALRALPAASMPRGRRQSLLREAHASPISTGLAEPGMPNWGQMYEATEEGRAQVTRAMTANELGKEDAYTRVQADMRTGGPGPSMGIWAPSRVRMTEDDAVVANGSVSSRESARKDGRRRLSMAEEYAFLQYFPQRTDLIAVAKIHGPEGAPARAQLRELLNDVFSNSNLNSNSNSSINTESRDSSLSSADRADIHRMANLTPAEMERLRLLGLEHMAPGPEVQGYDRWAAISEIRDVFREFSSNTSSIHSQHSFDDPLHLSGGEILLLRRQGPEGDEYIRRATTSADQEIVMDQVAEARAFLSAALIRGRSDSSSRSRSGSRSTLSRSSGSNSTGSMLRAYQSTHAAAFPEGSQSTESSGTGPLESLSPLSSVSSSSRSSRSSRGSRGSRG